MLTETSTAFVQLTSDIHILVILGIILVAIGIIDFVRRFFMFSR